MSGGLSHEEFIGAWRIERIIVDSLAKGSARFVGHAFIDAGPAQWSYREEGQLTLAGGQQVWAERRYLWTPVKAGFDIFFDDGRFFHQMEFGAQSKAAHWCEPDQYDVRYDFAGWPEWRSVWDVKGPRKSYRMSSHYQRGI